MLGVGINGDDRIQQQTQGRVDPETFTHGTSEQRKSWFNRGYTTGDYTRCTTFAVRAELHDLHHMGVGIALDDFGTGSSSLTLQFPSGRDRHATPQPDRAIV